MHPISQSTETQKIEKKINVGCLNFFIEMVLDFGSIQMRVAECVWDRSHNGWSKPLWLASCRVQSTPTIHLGVELLCDNNMKKENERLMEKCANASHPQSLELFYCDHVLSETTKIWEKQTQFSKYHTLLPMLPIMKDYQHRR